MKQKLSRLLSLFVVMFTMCLPTMAASYSSKMVATPVGEGKVYVGTPKDTPTYVEGSDDETITSEGQTSAPTHTYHLYAQANEGNEFVGWYDNAQCSGEALSTASPYIKEITADKEVANATETYYAKFRKIGVPILSYGEGHPYVNLSAGTYKNETLTTENVTETITYVSSNENVATVASDGTVTAIKNGSCIITAKSGEAEASYVITVIDDVNAGITQIGNGDFEDWRNVTSSNHAPSNWNSFETAEGSVATGALASTVIKQQVSMVEGGRPGSDGLYCVDIYSRNPIGNIIANGNLTLGCINAGSTTPEDDTNYNFSKILDSSKSETISKIPSAIKFWVKYVPTSLNEANPYARMAATVHDAYNYITHGLATSDTDENKAHAIAQAELNFSACEWTEITVPFVPTGNTTDGQMYIVVNFTTNSTPGSGGKNDHLYIDDVELIYPEDPAPVVYAKYINVAVDGSYNTPQPASIEVTYNEDGTIEFNLKNFALELEDNDTPIYVGNITLHGLDMDEEGKFSYNGSIQINSGDLEGVESWLGPELGDIPAVLEGTIKDGYFYVHIDINVGYPVEVEVGDLANATVSVSDALVTTFCAPFAVTIPADYQSFVTASTVTGINGRLLILEPVSDYVIPANTPVVIQTPVAAQLPVSGIFVKDTPVAGLLTGVYENTPAPVGSYVLQNLNGKVGFYLVAEGKQPTLGANRCYLTVPASGVKAFYLDGNDATGISNVDANVDANEVIYNIAGQRINELQKGINIVNGKKILK